MKKESVNIRLSAWEHNLYRAGVKLGHCEGARESAEQLRKAAAHYREHIETREELGADQIAALASWMEVFDNISKQIDDGATLAQQQASSQMNEAFRIRHRSGPTLPERIKRAIIGAIEGYTKEV